MTEDEKKEVVQEVLNQIKADSQSVDELTEVTSLDNVKSLPAMKGETLVSAPISLLSKPAEDAATVATTAATAANEAATKVEAAITKAEEATTKANEAAEIAEDAATKFVGSINVDEIDNIPASKADAYAMIKDVQHSRWTLTYKQSDTVTLNVGVIDIFSDNMHHQLTEVLTTHYGTTDGGIDFNGHTDSQIFTYWRSYNLTKAAWTEWQEFVPYSVQTFMGVKNEEVAALQSDLKTLFPEEYEKSGIFFENAFAFDTLSATAGYANYQKNDDNIEFTLIGSGYGGVQYAELKVKCENADVSAGDVVFVRLKAKISTIENISTTKFIYPMQKSRNTAMEDISAADTYTTLYGIYSFADGVFEKQIWLRPAFSSRDAATDVKVTVKDIEVYNLTKVYGAGNEPTSAADVNALIGDEFHPYRVNIIDAKQINDDVTSLNDEIKKVGNFGKIKNYFGSTSDTFTQ